MSKFFTPYICYGYSENDESGTLTVRNVTEEEFAEIVKNYDGAILMSIMIGRNKKETAERRNNVDAWFDSFNPHPVQVPGYNEED